MFRYSPFTELTQQQAKIIEDVLSIERSFLIFLIKGGAGTGKTVLLTNLVARFSETIQVGVVVKNNWIGTLKKILKAYPVGNNIDVGSAYQIITNNKKYDIIIVDEAHRLRWGYPKQDHKRFGIFDKNEPKKNELYLLGEKTKRLVLLYDSLQTIRPSDIPRSDFESYIKEKSFLGRSLSKQFRVQIKDAGACYTAEDYIRGMQCFLQLENQSYDKRVFQNKAPDAYFGVTNSIYELFEYVDKQRQYNPVKQCRVLAGYARPWNSKRKPDHKKYTEFDWVEGKNSWKWNSTQEDWISRPGSEDEIGSIHAVQGIDLDYVGLIVANDLTYKDGQVMAIKENYYDVNGTPVIKGFSLEELTQYIKQIYYVLLTRGICGIRVYFEDEALRKHFMEEVGLNEQGNH